MNIFIDKKDRKISIETDAESAYAFYEKRKIGFVETTGLIEVDERCPPQPAEITGWEIDSDFQKSGIGTEMVRLLYEELDMMIPPEKNIGIGGQNTLTDEGLAITIRCQELGYISPFPEDT